jgi:peptidoglycan/LPS O-acetylase OafA/YrhL
VEEQFYLLWPLVVLWVSAARLAPIALGLVIFSFASEAVGALQGRSFEETHLVLQGCMDALGLGALLAVCAHRDRKGGDSAGRLSFWAALVGAPLFFFAQGFRYQVGLRATDLLPYRIPGDLGIALISLSLVYLATTSGPSFLRGFLELAPVRYLGRISYGIYLYHLFLIPIGRVVAREYGLPELERGLEMFLLYGAISIVLATVSWYAIESPVNRQKRRFPFPPRPVSTLP